MVQIAIPVYYYLKDKQQHSLMKDFQHFISQSVLMKWSGMPLTTVFAALKKSLMEIRQINLLSLKPQIFLKGIQEK